MIAIVGMAGCGKSTQRDLLVNQLQCAWVYPGQLLRDNLTGQQQSEITAGKHIDDDITIPLLEADFVKKQVSQKECVLDGAPRTLKQAVWFADKVKSGQIMPTGVIHLVMTNQEAQRRLQERHRHDDHQSGIVERFKVYETQMRPGLDYLAEHGIKVYEIDAAGTPAQVNERIRKALGLA